MLQCGARGLSPASPECRPTGLKFSGWLSPGVTPGANEFRPSGLDSRYCAIVDSSRTPCGPSTDPLPHRLQRSRRLAFPGLTPEANECRPSGLDPWWCAISIRSDNLRAHFACVHWLVCALFPIPNEIFPRQRRSLSMFVGESNRV